MHTGVLLFREESFFLPAFLGVRVQIYLEMLVGHTGVLLFTRRKFFDGCLLGRSRSNYLEILVRRTSVLPIAPYRCAFISR